MKIAINSKKGSYSDFWIEYCKNNDIQYKVVNCYDDNIIDEISDCDILMWHWYHIYSQDVLFARQIIFSIELSGKMVFPNIRTCQLYDDKVGQKYLFEAFNLPFVRSYVFYNKKDAVNWIKHTSFPKVFKLRGGASSANVKLVNNKKKARKLVRRSFGKGFKSFNRVAVLKDRILIFRNNRNLSTFKLLCKGYFRVFFPKKYERLKYREKNYIYFQDFIPDCSYDIRVVVVGDRAFAIKRYVRKNDFRASGSGLIDYDPGAIDIEYIKLTFDINEKLKMQSVALDFVKHGGKILLLEISYIWAVNSFGKHPGYWNSDLTWIEGEFCPADFIIEDMIKDI